MKRIALLAVVVLACVNMSAQAPSMTIECYWRDGAFHCPTTLPVTSMKTQSLKSTSPAFASSLPLRENINRHPRGASQVELDTQEPTCCEKESVIVWGSDAVIHPVLVKQDSKNMRVYIFRQPQKSDGCFLGPETPVFKKLCAVLGVSGAQVDPTNAYNVNVYKAESYTWAEVQPKVLAAFDAGFWKWAKEDKRFVGCHTSLTGGSEFECLGLLGTRDVFASTLRKGNGHWSDLGGGIDVTCFADDPDCPKLPSAITHIEHDPFAETVRVPHRWASELDGKVEKDGCRWIIYNMKAHKECPTGAPELRDDGGISIVGRAAWKLKETYILDWCLEHGETRVIRKEPTKP